MPRSEDSIPSTESITRAEKPKKRRTLITLEVVRTQRLSPSMVRVVLGGPNFTYFKNNEYTDRYIKLQFFPQQMPDLSGQDANELKKALAKDQQPTSRTYTVRGVDVDSRELSVDFVVHGDSGLAGPWAASAQKGDRLHLIGPGGGYAPQPSTPYHLLSGDESSLPAIAAALEAMPVNALGRAFIEVPDQASELDLAHPAGVEITWLHRGQSYTRPELQAETIRSLELPVEATQAFLHGERTAVKALRDVVIKEKGIPKSQVSISGYWAYGRKEDDFQAEKQLPIGQI